MTNEPTFRDNNPLNAEAGAAAQTEARPDGAAASRPIPEDDPVMTAHRPAKEAKGVAEEEFMIP